MTLNLRLSKPVQLQLEATRPEKAIKAGNPVRMH